MLLSVELTDAEHAHMVEAQKTMHADDLGIVLKAAILAFRPTGPVMASTAVAGATTAVSKPAA